MPKTLEDADGLSCEGYNLYWYLNSLPLQLIDNMEWNSANGQIQPTIQFVWSFRRKAMFQKLGNVLLNYILDETVFVKSVVYDLLLLVYLRMCHFLIAIKGCC